MTFKEAVEEMKKLAEGDDWSFVYEVRSWASDCQIHGYIANKGGHANDAITYAQAIENVKQMINPVVPKPLAQENEPAPEDKEEPNA